MKKFTLSLSFALGVSVMGTGASAATINGIFCGNEVATPHIEAIENWQNTTGNTVNIEMVPWGQCQDKVFTLAGAGSPPDFAYMGSRTLGQLADADLIEPSRLSDAELAEYYPNVLKTFVADGTAWSYPVAFSTKAVYYNKDLFTQAGITEFPKTWDDFLRATKTVKERTGEPGYGMIAKAFDQTFHQFLNWLYSNGGEVLNDRGDVVFESPSAIQTAAFLKELADYSQSGPAAHDRSSLLELFNNGKVASYISGPWDTREGRISEDINWGVAPIPYGPSGSGSGTLLITDSVVVFKRTGNEDITHAFAKYLTNAENQFKLETEWKMTPMRPHPEWKNIIAEKPTWQVFINGIANGGPESLFTDFRGAQETFIQNIQDLVTSDASPEEVVANIQEDLENL